MLARTDGKQTENGTIFNRVGDVKIRQRRNGLFGREENVRGSGEKVPKVNIQFLYIFGTD